MTPRVRIPAFLDLREAVKIYYSKMDLSVKDIIALFGISKSTAVKLKALAMESCREHHTPIWSATRVPTNQAFTAWGYDIAELEARLKKLDEIERREHRNA